MRKWYEMIKDERAGVMVENVIVLPMVFIVIYSFILTAFIVHDRSTVESAAKRGAVYASHCVSDPNYASIAGQSGELDVAADRNFSFSDVGNNIDAYRYIFGGDSIEGAVETKVKNIVEKTRIKWRSQESVTVTCTQKNRFIYQDITVSVSAKYSIPAFFAVFGLETDYEYTATAKIAANDPDEFIRNADLVVDLMTTIDNKMGSPIQKALDKIGTLGNKIADWFSVDK